MDLMNLIRRNVNERGSGVAIYIFTVFIIASIVMIMVVLMLLNRVDSIKQRAQVLLFHALSDAVHTTEIVPNYVNGQLVNNVYIPPDRALRSFCTTFDDDVSVARIFDVQDVGSNCVGILMPANVGNKDFPHGIWVTDFVVINDLSDPILDRIEIIRGKDFKPPFIFARIEVPQTFMIGGRTYNFNLPVAAVYRPALLDTIKGDFVTPSF